MAKAKSPRFGTDESQSVAAARRPGPRQMRWLAVVSILIMSTCMAAAATIIIASNGQIVASWSVSPTVLLAILSALWSYSLGALLVMSAVIRLSPLSALQASIDLRRVLFLAWLVVAAQISNNPLLQRSTSIGSAILVTEDALMLDMVPLLPDGWLGWIQNASLAHIVRSRNGLSTTQGWRWNETLLTYNKTGYRCDGRCEGKVQGAGISYNCTSKTMTLDLSATGNNGSVIFAVNTTMSTNSTGAPILLLTTLYASAVNSSCMATLSVNTCSIEAAVVEYPIVIQNTTVMLAKEKLDNMTIVSTYISAGDLPTAAKEQGSGPLEGLNDFIRGYLSAYDTVQIGQFTTTHSGDLMGDLFSLPEVSPYDADIFRTCGLTWSSPTQYVLDSMQEYLFRASLLASTDADAQTFTVERANLALIFQSQYHYLISALSIMMAALLAVVFQLRDCWGLQVGPSALELTQTARPPMIEQTMENSACNETVRVIGNTTVRFDREGLREVGIPRNAKVEYE